MPANLNLMNKTESANADCLQRGVRRRHSEETKQRIAESVRSAHAQNPRSETSLAKMRASLIKAHAEGRAGGFKKGNKLSLLRGIADLQRCVRIAQQACIGKHGFGKMHIGLPDHIFAKYWVIESPDGMRYECENLLAWCRENEHLLPVDDAKYKQPLWRRAAMGIGKQALKETRLQWRGWRLITVGKSPNDQAQARRTGGVDCK